MQGSPVIVRHLPVAAADPSMDTVLATKAALKRAVQHRERARAMFQAAEVDVEQLAALVRRLEAQ
jgi:hypothetical protein